MASQYHLKDVVHETDDHFILRVPFGFAVYRKHSSYSVRCAQIGFTGITGLQRAINEVERREAL